METEWRQTSPLRDYLGVVQRRKWIIVQAVLLVPAIAVGFSLQQPARYEATAEVLVSRQNLASSLTGTPDPLAGQSPDRLVQTQADLARVPEVARRVLRKVKLAERDVEDFLSASSVAAKSNSDLLVFTASARVPDTAARLATEYARQFTTYRRELDSAALVRARREVAARLRQLESNDQQRSALYASLLDKEQQLRTLEALQTSNALLVRRAESARKVQPRPARNGMLGLALGLLLGIGLAFLREALDTRVRSAEEISRGLGLPLLARLPEPPSRLRKHDQLVMVAEPSGPHAEAFRMLRTNLEFAALDHDVRTIMITSAVEREGKSTTAANLAVAFARAGQRVILVDLDLRRPFLNRFFDVDGTPGLTQVALGHASLHEAEAPVTVNGVPGHPAGNGFKPQPNLSVICSGPLPPDPGEFVAASTVTDILRSLRALADVVIVDAPPLLHVGDALVLAGKVDAVVLVTRLDVVRRRMLGEVRRLLDATAAHKLGFVATNAEAEDQYDYPGYYAYYTQEPQKEHVI